jgi:ferredoxin/flavodoxin---NADP+ reductase
LSDKVAVRVTAVWAHTDHLFSFRTERPEGFRFTPGQFARLGIPVSSENTEVPESSWVWRAYSIASGPFDPFLEYYSIVVPGGAFTSRLSQLREGDTLWMEMQNHGFLTLERFALAGDLWLLSSGTGLAPFLSILQDPLTWESFSKIVLVHSVRAAPELAYREDILALRRHEIFGDWADKLHYQPVITRDCAQSVPGSLTARIPELVRSGKLEEACGQALTVSDSKIMLCGNPEMVSDTRKALKERGFVSARSSRPGQIATENYW